MGISNSIDVVIPSFRLDEKILMAIFNLEQPVDYKITYYLISDNPTIIIPRSIQCLASENKITLIVNKTNLGFSQTRNKGIDAGTGSWILLLDDDITPSNNLLLDYAEAIKDVPDSIGFIGPTNFPEPFNSITKALRFNGSLGHFQSAYNNAELIWAPTANILLNRLLLGQRRFNTGLKSGGEDIDLLVRNSLTNNRLYKSVPAACVTHPWWDNGGIQVKRLFRYGIGTADVMKLPHIKPYTFFDFTNTIETILLLIALNLSALLLGIDSIFFFVLICVILISEFFTNLIKSIKLSGVISLPLAFQMFLHKNAYEAGMVWSNIRSCRLFYLGRRLDLGFKKIAPNHFRLNKWKIIKLLIIIVGLLVMYFTPNN